MLLRRHSAGICHLSSLQAALLERHYNALRQWNRTLNLTSLEDPEEVVTRHYCESLALGWALPKGSWEVMDLGSGAGFPGYPMAVLRAECRFTLVESHQRKSIFLREVTNGFSNIRVLAARGEHIGERFDWVVSRAVDPDVVVALAQRLGAAVGLLTVWAAADRLRRGTGFQWDEPQLLPWGERRVILLGHVSRGTTSI